MKEKKLKYKHLSETEMFTIYEMRSGGKTVQEIANWVKRSKSTVSECLNYRPKDERFWRWSNIQKAEYYYRSRLKRDRPRSRKLAKDTELRDYVVAKLTEGAYSPEDVAYLAHKELGKTICFKTIYTYIKKENSELKKYLLEGGKARRQRVSHRRGKFKQAAPLMKSVTERPDSAKTEFGHFEVDLLQVRSGYFLSLRELKTRKQFLIPIKYKKAKLVKETLIAFFAKLGKDIVKTITFDRGGEFAPSELSELERLFTFLELLYCEPYRPYQKGCVENGHRWLRKPIPRNSNFSDYTEESVNRICFFVNQKPMKCLNRLSPNYLWELEFKQAA